MKTIRILCLVSVAALLQLASAAQAQPTAEGVSWLAPGPVGPTELSLQNGAVAVSCAWRNQYSGESGTATPVALSMETGTFFFYSSTNYEVFVKALDWWPDNRAYQLFWGGLTDLEYTLTFRQTATGQVLTAPTKLAGSTCGSLNTTDLVRPPNASPSEVTVMLPGGVPLVLVKVPAGTFQMGSPATEERRESNETLHQVTLTSDYYVGRTEVTQEQWQAVTGSPMPVSCGSYGVGATYPVYCVSWTEIAGPGGFLEKLNAHLSSTGQPGAGKYRLPTEAEWERAARGGTQTRFSFGDALDSNDSCGGPSPASAQALPNMWWCANAGSATHPVGTKLANQLGLFDMHGNVSEWCQDRYGPYPTTPQTDPFGAASGFPNVRGGDFLSSLGGSRAASRFNIIPDGAQSRIGFRIARPL